MDAVQPAARPGDIPVGRAKHELPNVWWGYALAGCFLVVTLGEGVMKLKLKPASTAASDDFLPLSLLVLFAEVLYWLFCIFRIHQVLAEATKGTYPIGPRKALGFLFIPFFNIYWLFRWTNEIACFVNQQHSTFRMWKGWPGLVITLALIIDSMATGIEKTFEAAFVLTAMGGAIGSSMKYAALHRLKHNLEKVLPR